MPYKRIGNKIYTKSSGKWKLKQTAKSVAAAIRAMKLLQGLEHGSIKPSEVGKGKYAKAWKRGLDKELDVFGEIDFGNKTLKVNPKKGDMLNTIIHEELHKKYPDKSEKWIYKKARNQEEKLNIWKSIKLLEKYKRKQIFNPQKWEAYRKKHFKL